MVAIVLTATSYAHREHGQRNALYLHIVSWVMQFIGHGVAEGRSPALLDNLLGGVFHCDHVLHCVSSRSYPAALLAPFFVHLEVCRRLYRAQGLLITFNSSGSVPPRLP